VIGVLLALYHRKVNGGQGQYIDMALYEAVFNMLESTLPEYDAFGVIRERTGSALPGIAPTSAYLCRNDQYVLVAGNGDSIFKRLMEAIGRSDLATDPDLAHNEGRVRRVAELDRAIGDWAAARSIEEVLDTMTKARVPAGRIYSVKDIVEDPHYAARGMVEEIVTRDGLTLKTPGVVPKLSETPGSIRITAPRLGEDTEAVLQRLGYTAAQIAALRAAGVI